MAENNQIINLTFQRTANSTRRCTFPDCNTTDNLHKVSNAVRFKVMIKTNTFIPNGARACAHHITEDRWNDVRDCDRHWFTSKHIEDLINLLCNSKLEKISAAPRNFNLCYLLLIELYKTL